MNWIKRLFDDGSVDMRKHQPSLPVSEPETVWNPPTYYAKPPFVIMATGTSIHPHVASTLTSYYRGPSE